MDSSSSRASDIDIPLCSDLDGTVIRSDVLFESTLRLLSDRPALAFALPFWLLKGRAHLKRRIAERAPVDPALLPYNDAVIAFLRAEKERGRRVVLSTASDERLARRIADHLRFFDDVVGSDGVSNFKGSAKADKLSALFGEKKFDYVGDGAVDLAVWRRARRGFLAGGSPALAARAAREAGVARIAPPRERARLRDVLFDPLAPASLLAFVPLFFHHPVETRAVASSAAAFALFVLASAGNALLFRLGSLADDRADPARRDGALASGRFPLSQALGLAVALPAAAVVLSLALPEGATFALILATALAAVASFEFKRRSAGRAVGRAAIAVLPLLAGEAVAHVALPATSIIILFGLFLVLAWKTR